MTRTGQNVRLTRAEHLSLAHLYMRSYLAVGHVTILLIGEAFIEHDGVQVTAAV